MNGTNLLHKRMIQQCLICILLLCPLAASAETVTYQYDARHRLIGATYDSGETFGYTYDGTDNRLQKTVVTPITSSTPPRVQAAGASLAMGAASKSTSTVSQGSAPLQGLGSQSHTQNDISRGWRIDNSPAWALSTPSEHQWW